MPRTKLTLKERLLSHVKIDPVTGCWMWIASCKPAGYGQLTVFVDGEPQCGLYAHRVSYEEFVGPIPDGLTLDHTCHDPDKCAGGNACPHRKCINPDHLNPSTHKENIARGACPTALLHGASHCRHGHEYTESNTLMYRGQRYCRACAKANQLRNRAKYRAKERERYWANPAASRKRSREKATKARIITKQRQAKQRQR